MCTVLLPSSLGGELQRFAIAVVAAQAADIYMIDEPSSYLDVRQRLKAAQVMKAIGFSCTSMSYVYLLSSNRSSTCTVTPVVQMSAVCCARSGIAFFQ